MGKFRTKLKGLAKGKRWARGQSSSSNPQTKTYRIQAKSRFFQENLGSSNLTTTAIKKHDAQQTYASIEMPGQLMQVDENTESETVYSYATSNESAKTFASDWTNCSNMSFGRFMNVFHSNSILHREMLSILAAITDVIKSNNGSETSSEYYCALVTTLEQVMESCEKNENQITAVLSLIHMGITTVPGGVLRQSYDSLTSKLLKILIEFGSKDNNIVVKSILGILSVLLMHQELVIWQSLHTKQIFEAILNPFCIHSKPKWRKAAQRAVISVLSSGMFQKDQHHSPPADIVAMFIKGTLESCFGINANGAVLVSSIQASQTTILYTLGLLKNTISFFNKTDVKCLCETVFRLITLNYPIVTSCGMQVLHALFSAKRSIAGAKVSGQIIAAMYDYRPSAVDTPPTLAWLAVMRQAYIHLADVDLYQCAFALPQIFNIVTHLWLSQKSEIVMGATHTLEALLRDAISQICADAQLPKETTENKLAECIQTVELGLSYQYSHAWPQILHVISVMLEVCGSHYPNVLLNTLKTLSELRDSYKFSFNNELEHTVGTAVKFVGPELVLTVMPLRKETGELNLDRSWLLPVLKANVQRSTLDFWLRAIYPLALHCQRRAVELGECNDGIGAHSAELLHLQLWHLLPSFCNLATDIQTGFKSIAKLLGMTISDRKDLRLAVLTSLRKLIMGARESGNSNDINEIAKYDKNFLPILFNVYTSKPIGSHEEGQRLATMDTIKMFLEIARPDFTGSLFTSAIERLNTLNSHPPEGDDLFHKESIMDLMKAMLRYQDSVNIEQIFNMCIKHLPELGSHKEQKKTYRLLEEICANNTEGCTRFLNAHRRLVQKLLIKSLNTSAVSSKSARLRCLNYLLVAQPQLDQDSNLIRSTIPEAVLGCKDQNQRCRLISYEVLNTIGDILLRHDQMKQYVALLICGLTGTTELMSATLLAIASILHHFTGALGQANIDFILENVLLLLKVSTRDVVGACLSFLKVYVMCLPTPKVATQLGNIVAGMCTMSDDCQRNFRMKIRNMLCRLIRKFGCDAITPHIPTNDKVMYKRLRNLRKLQNRRKRKGQDRDRYPKDLDEEFTIKAKSKTVEDILADSDDDIDDTFSKMDGRGARKFTTFIEEDSGDIVDFQDTSVIGKITTLKPRYITPTQILTPKKGNWPFKTAADGRLIIADSSDLDSEKSNKKRTNAHSSSDSDSDHDNISKAETEILRDVKREKSNGTSVARSFQFTYRAGGSGIHRNTMATDTNKSPTRGVKNIASSGNEYRAKNAIGDIKKKGRVDPYAYLPLQRYLLNKRKKSKHTGQFENIIGAAKSGSKRGVKARKRLQK